MWNSAIRMTILLTLVAASAVGFTWAEEDRWKFRFQPVYMTAFGHDQHVLNIYENDLDGSPVSTRTGVNLSTDTGLAYRLEAQYAWNRWDLGFDFLWFVTSQSGAGRSAAPGGDVDEVVFEIAGRSYASGDPSDVLYFSLLEDNDLAMWTFDLYGSRILMETPESELRLRLGLRIGDFDNDYRSAAGIEGVAGTRLDRSSNYAALIGPAVGLTGVLHRGNHSFHGSFGQSVLIGTADLFGTVQDFTGPFSETPAVFNLERIYRAQDVAIPVTEIRLGYRYRLSEHFAVNAGINSSA